MEAVVAAAAEVRIPPLVALVELRQPHREVLVEAAV
jgi:hypothetical protein